MIEQSTLIWVSHHFKATNRQASINFPSGSDLPMRQTYFPCSILQSVFGVCYILCLACFSGLHAWRAYVLYVLIYLCFLRVTVFYVLYVSYVSSIFFGPYTPSFYYVSSFFLRFFIFLCAFIAVRVLATCSHFLTYRILLGRFSLRDFQEMFVPPPFWPPSSTFRNFVFLLFYCPLPSPKCQKVLSFLLKLWIFCC